ncbi:unnamed protein product [Rhizoctonia solani]|uniref:Uncharacterized protein n=1 Tax=Rhizoctonia solani TaxID=456999 RepID=A0A8H2W681_9AGAM|nr:unnamed protein product [Rhizoctonia solani]
MQGTGATSDTSESTPTSTPGGGLMFWLDPEGKEGPQSLYSACVYCWWHYLASTPTAFQNFAQWHCHSFLLAPPVVSAPLSASELHAAILNLVLLYPTNPPNVPASSHASSPALTVSEESLLTQPADVTALPTFQLSNSPNSSKVLWRAPTPPTHNWPLFSFKGWSQEEIQRHREAWDLTYRQGEEVTMLINFSNWLL